MPSVLNAYAVIEHEMQKADLKEHRRFSDLVHRAAKINPGEQLNSI